MVDYSKSDILFISLGIQLKTLSKQELEIALSFLDEETSRVIIEILTEKK